MRKIVCVVGAVALASGLWACQLPDTVELGGATVKVYQDASKAPFPFTGVGQKFEYRTTWAFGDNTMQGTSVWEVKKLTATTATVSQVDDMPEIKVTHATSTDFKRGELLGSIKVVQGTYSQDGTTIKAESVTVPAGTFQSNKVSVTIPDGKASMWLEESTGVIKQVVDFAPGKIQGLPGDPAVNATYELKSVTGG